MLKSESIGSLAKALSAAQGEMGPARKGSKNPFFKSSYADLSSVTDAIREPLAAHGIAYVQTIEPSETGQVFIHTVLMHESGEWIESVLPIKPVKQDPQGMGSAITYGKRYGLQAIVCLPSADDDGEASFGRGRKPARQPAPQPSPKPVRGTITDAQVQKLAILANEMGLTREQKVKGCVHNVGRVVSSSTELTKEEASRVIEAMQAKLNEKKEVA